MTEAFDIYRIMIKKNTRRTCRYELIDTNRHHMYFFVVKLLIHHGPLTVCNTYLRFNSNVSLIDLNRTFSRSKKPVTLMADLRARRRAFLCSSQIDHHTPSTSLHLQMSLISLTLSSTLSPITTKADLLYPLPSSSHISFMLYIYQIKIELKNTTKYNRQTRPS